MEPNLGFLLGIGAMAVLFSILGVLPLTHRSCGDCGGDCGSCSLSEEER